MTSESRELPLVERTARTLLLGAGAGVIATLAMSALMYGEQKLGLLGRAPPRHIIEHALARLGIRRHVSSPARAGLTALTHLGFGATQGAIYALLQDFASQRFAKVKAPSITTSVPFALAVWAASYAGWIPALNILPKPRNDRPGRPTSMVLAHILYGATLSGVLRRSRERRGLARTTA